jgi:carboxypeptidase Taq
MPHTAAQAYDDLIQRVKEYNVLGSCKSLLDWDEQTYMPKKGSAHRAEQMGLLAKLGHAMLTAPQVGEALAAVEGTEMTKNPESDSAVNIREIRRAYERATKLPEKLVQEIARTTTLAGPVWREARKENNFQKFRPWLEKVVALKREEAQCVGYQDAPYDALLDEYEPGATAAQVTKVFADLRQDLVPFLQAIIVSGKKPKRDVLEREYAIDRQRLFGQEAGAAIGFDFLAGRLDVTTHPFCSGIGPGDCRITTRYNERQFNDAFFSILHEAGHGIYDQGLPAEHYGTPRGSFISLGIHESQSRLWENQVGRSQPFWEHFFPRARQVFPESLTGVALEDFYFAINDVQPSFIRVEADEVTYNLHIILRFELEQALVRGDLPPADVPKVWNEKFKQFFNLMPPTDSLGCLQDVHWSLGGIGYFPTYTLGNLYAAQFMDQARQDLGELAGDFRQGNFQRLKTWLNDKIHQPGQRYRAGALCEKVTGTPLSHKPLLRYMKEKFGGLYGV